MKKVRLLYVGIGGYGVTNLDRYLSGSLTDCEIAGTVDIRPENSFFYERLKKDGVPFYSSLEEFCEKDHADLAILSTPIQLHAPQSIFCMRHGMNVLCEKPVASTLEEAREMLKVSEETGKFVNIGYQASYSEATLRFKADVTAGRFGKPLAARTLVMWPRSEKYYGRSAWAGKLKSADGKWILDSVANNATAHYLHNMFYVLGGGDNRSLVPEKMEFELYRGNNIESFDTCAARITAGGIPLLFIAAHPIDHSFGPQIEFRFEKATVTVPGKGDDITARMNDGTVIEYGSMQNGATLKIQ
ncbi:MAG: Gfo/Idh/MocA family oxidoreductase, partial [Clostridia bacterium]|nr:Gfo/Idh/MocA family oxidoreductase [Clostridia bacterium]